MNVCASLCLTVTTCCVSLHKSDRVQAGFLLQVEEQFKGVVLPFIHRQKRLKWPEHEQQQYALYRWATAVVSAYSFTLGEDKFQAMVGCTCWLLSCPWMRACFVASAVSTCIRQSIMPCAQHHNEPKLCDNSMLL